jgi:hypothetical protein
LRRSLDLVLGLRGLTPSPAQRSDIDACTSVEVIERWIVRAATVGSVTEMLEA